jgi:beta-lactam-binding protein with PASTA domain
LKTVGFEVGKVVYDETADGAVGAVIGQNPAGGERAKAGSLVVLTVAGSPPVATPDLSGLDEEKATAALEAAGLRVGGVTESYDTSVAAGLLVSQAPGAGTEAPKGSAVAIVVSKGRQPVSVPSVTGKPQSEATAVLEAAGFEVKTAEKADKAAKGTVIAQAPTGGEAQPGSTVTITLSSGVEMITVPNVYGLSTSDAATKIRKAGLVPREHQVWTEDVNDIPGGWEAIYLAYINSHDGWAAVVYKQSPKAGVSVPRGSEVDVYGAYEAG